MADYSELKELAEAAQRNWPDSKLFERPECERFIDSARPDVVLALIAENERLKLVSNFQEAVACVFDFAKIAAANTSCREWDDQLEDFAEDVIDFAPEYKRQWLDIVKLTIECDQLKAEIDGLKACIASDEKKLDALLNHCDEGECATCGQIICPHGDGMHFHHDGCPSCAQEPGHD